MIIGFCGFIGYLSYQSYQKKMGSWQKFAQTNHLEFIPGTFFGKGTCVAGHYRGYLLKLDICKNGDKTYTCLTLSVPQRVNGHHIPKNGSLCDKQITIKDIINALTSTYTPYALRGKIKAEAYGQTMYYKQPDIEGDVQYLQFLLDRLCDLADVYPAIVALGGEIMLTLGDLMANKSNKLRPMTLQLMRDIANDTARRLNSQALHLLCPRCLTCWDTHVVSWTYWDAIMYYGCRTCGQSREVFQGWVIAVLDSLTTTEQFMQDGILRINWLTHRALFDFDEVQIFHATDEEVERFAVQVGNDTDELRQSRYKQMRCIIASDCELSENTIRILQRMFGQVKVGLVK